MDRILSVLYEDNHCLAVNKPAGLLTQGVPDGIPTLESQAREYLKVTYHKAGKVYLGIPHRLDRPVSGVVLFARSSKAAARLAEQFRDRLVQKVYVGLVEHNGNLPPPRGKWDDWMRKIQSEARSEVVPAQTPEAKNASLCFERLGQQNQLALLRFEPLTGRMHQIRVQCASRGWPLAGDKLYGGQQIFGPATEESRDKAIALHALGLTILHPIRYEPVSLFAPLPDYWPLWARQLLLRSQGESVSPGEQP
ncbi:MAG: RluA family pseudouridine synthase [Gemmataceae bacterium]